MGQLKKIPGRNKAGKVAREPGPNLRIQRQMYKYARYKIIEDVIIGQWVKDGRPKESSARKIHIAPGFVVVKGYPEYEVGEKDKLQAKNNDQAVSYGSGQLPEKVPVPGPGFYNGKCGHFEKLVCCKIG